MTLAILASIALMPSRWSLAVGGDIMLNRVSVSSKPFERIAPFFSDSTVAVANLEIPLTTSSTPTRRKTAADIRAKRQFILKADPGHFKGLSESGFDLLSLANNHIMDYGVKGLNEVRLGLQMLGINYAGAGLTEAAAHRPGIHELKGGQKVVLLSYLSFMGDGSNWTCTPAKGKEPGLASLMFGGTVDDKDKKVISKAVQGAKKKGEFVAVAIHWGLERQPVPTPYQVALARAFIDAGADAILGHHPHVLQGAEVYKEKAIFYSLGNLVSVMRYDSAAFRVEYSDKRIVGCQIAPFSLPGGKPNPYSRTAASAALRRFEVLCDRLAKAFPSKQSRPLSVRLWKPAK